MTTRNLVLAGVAFAVLTIVGVFLPWVALPPEVHALRDSMRDAMRQMPEGFGGAAARMDISDPNGTADGLNGTGVLVLAFVGGLACVAVAFGKPGTLPVSSSALLWIAAGAFSLGWLLTLADFFREWGPASRGIGIYLTLLATLLGAAAAVQALRRTPAAAASPPGPPPSAA